MIKLVLFDVDGTLSLTEPSTFVIENQVLTRMGLPSMKREAHLNNWGKPLDQAIVERVPGINGDRFMKIYETVLPEFIEKGELDIISPKTLNVLDELKKSGIKLAILTARNKLEVSHLMHEEHVLSERIEAVYHNDNLDYLKPHPKAFDRALHHFKVAPSEAVYVGDTVTDGICAKGAGLHFIALLESGVRTREDFAGIRVDFFAEKMEDILKYVDKVNCEN